MRRRPSKRKGSSYNTVDDIIGQGDRREEEEEEGNPGRRCQGTNGIRKNSLYCESHRKGRRDVSLIRFAKYGREKTTDNNSDEDPVDQVRWITPFRCESQATDGDTQTRNEKQKLGNETACDILQQKGQ